MPAETHTSSHTDTHAPIRDFFTFGSLVQSDYAPVEYLVDELLVEGHHGVLTGPFSVGKTYGGLQLSKSLATGTSFMGRRVSRPCRVSFIDLENGGSEIKSRMLRMPGIDNLSPGEQSLLDRNWIYNDGVDPNDPLYGLVLDSKGFERLGDHLNRCQADVVIIDCFGKAFPWAERDEDKVKQLLTDIMKLQRKYPPLQKGLFLQFHHPVKPSNGDAPWPNLLDAPREWLGKVRGTGRLLDLSPIRLGFDQIFLPNGESAHVINGLIRGRMSPLVLERCEENGFFEPHSDKEFVVKSVFNKARKQLELVEAIRSRLRNQERIMWSEIEQIPPLSGSKYHTGTIHQALRTACSIKLLQKNEDRSYSLAR